MATAWTEEPKLQALLATDGKTTRLVDQHGKVFDPKSLQDKTVMSVSGFRSCAVCAKISKTLGKSIGALNNKKDVRVIVFNILPQTDEARREEYAKYYKDAGVDADKLTILFTETKNANGQWVPDDKKAKEMETALMLNNGLGHSQSIFVFDGEGKRMGDGTFAVVDNNSKQQMEKIRAVTNEVNTALGKGR